MTEPAQHSWPGKDLQWEFPTADRSADSWFQGPKVGPVFLVVLDGDGWEWSPSQQSERAIPLAVGAVVWTPQHGTWYLRRSSEATDLRLIAFPRCDGYTLRDVQAFAAPYAASRGLIAKKQHGIWKVAPALETANTAETRTRSGATGKMQVCTHVFIEFATAASTADCTATFTTESTGTELGKFTIPAGAVGMYRNLSFPPETSPLRTLAGEDLQLAITAPAGGAQLRSWFSGFEVDA